MLPSEFSYRMFQGLPEVISFSVAGQPVMIITLPETQHAENAEETNLDESLTNLVINRLKKHPSSSDQTVLFTKYGEENYLKIISVYESLEMISELTLEGAVALSVRQHLMDKETNTKTYPFNTWERQIRCIVSPLTGNNFECRLEAIPVKMIATDQEAGIPGIGLVRYDVAFAGEYYILTEADSLGITLSPDKLMLRKMEDYGLWILQSTSINHKLIHPVTNKETRPIAVVFSGMDNSNLIQALVNTQGTVCHAIGVGATCISIASRYIHKKLKKSFFTVSNLYGEQVTVMQSLPDKSLDSDLDLFSINLNVNLIQNGQMFV